MHSPQQADLFNIKDRHDLVFLGRKNPHAPNEAPQADANINPRLRGELQSQSINHVVSTSYSPYKTFEYRN